MWMIHLHINQKPDDDNFHVAVLATEDDEVDDICLE